MEHILPIGSVVKLIEGAQKIMIINRAPLYNNNGVIGYFDYSACYYPNGQTEQSVFFFNEEDIEEVYFEGYRDETEEEFCRIYEENIEKVNYPKLHLERIDKNSVKIIS